MSKTTFALGIAVILGIAALFVFAGGTSPVALAQEATATPAVECPPPPADGQMPAQPPADLPEECRPAGGMGMGMGAQTSSLVPAAADVPYADLSDAQMLDIYLPETGDGPFPLVIFVHGGAFKMGDKAMSVSDFEPLVAAGYAVASLNYRLSGEALFPAQIEDVKAAVRWLRANAEEYNLDPDRFASWGASAGGNLAAMLGVTGDVEDFDNPELGNAGVSSAVQATIDWFGPIDFAQMDAQFAADDVCDASAESHSAADSPESLLLGAALADVPELVAAASPLSYVSEADPPFFIQHGTADCNVPPAQSQQLADALLPVVGEDNVTLMFLEGAGHGGTEFSSAENMALVIEFLNGVFAAE